MEEESFEQKLAWHILMRVSLLFVSAWILGGRGREAVRESEKGRDGERDNSWKTNKDANKLEF